MGPWAGITKLTGLPRWATVQKACRLATNVGALTLIARFMGPTWGPPGADRTQVGPRWAPCWPHGPCSLGTYWNIFHDWVIVYDAATRQNNSGPLWYRQDDMSYRWASQMGLEASTSMTFNIFLCSSGYLMAWRGTRRRPSLLLVTARNRDAVNTNGKAITGSPVWNNWLEIVCVILMYFAGNVIQIPCHFIRVVVITFESLRWISVSWTNKLTV